MATLFVPLLYGQQWLPAAPVVAGLASAAVLRSLGSHAGNIFTAIGRPDLLTKIGIARALILVPMLIYCAHYGIAGVAIAQAMVTGVGVLATLVIAGRILSITLHDCWNELQPALIGTGGLALILVTIQLLAAGWPPLMVLAAAATAGTAGYAVALYVGCPDTMRHIGAGIVSVLNRIA